MWYLQQTAPAGVDPTMYKTFTEQFIIWKGFFSDNDVDSIRNHIETKYELAPATIVSDYNDDKNKQLRRSSVAWLTNEQDPLTINLYQRLSGLITHVNDMHWKLSLTSVETLQYTQYYSEDLGTYDWHQDDAITYSPIDSVRKLSFSILLDDPEKWEGGEFQSYSSGEEVITHNLKKGDIIFFPSPLLHRVTPVTKGTRTSLVGWVRGSNWK